MQWIGKDLLKLSCHFVAIGGSQAIILSIILMAAEKENRCETCSRSENVRPIPFWPGGCGFLIFFFVNCSQKVTST
jgi:hypothetical protein